MTDFFEGTNQASVPETSTVENTQSSADLQMIGEGKKYKDIADADKALFDKEQIIEQLKSENASLRGTVTKSDTLDKAIQLIAQQKEQTQQTSVTPTTSAETIASQFTPEKIRELAKDVYQNETKRQLFDRNRLEVATKIKQIYGTRSEEFLEKRAKELDLDIVEIKELAGKSPKAALNILIPQGEAPKTSGYSYTPTNQGALTKTYNPSNDQGLKDIRQDVKLGKRPASDIEEYLKVKYKL